MPDDVTIQPQLMAAGAARWDDGLAGLEAPGRRPAAAILALSTARPGAPIAGDGVRRLVPAGRRAGPGPLRHRPDRRAGAWSRSSATSAGRSPSPSPSWSARTRTPPPGSPRPTAPDRRPRAGGGRRCPATSPRPGATSLPAWATDLVALLTAGQAWPEASETAARELSRALEQLRTGLGRAAADHAAAGDLDPRRLGGPGGGGLRGDGPPARPQPRLGAARAGGRARPRTHVRPATSAAETEYTKLSINSAYYVTLAAIFAALAAAAFSLGIAAGAALPAVLAGRSVIVQLMERLAATAARDYGARAAAGQLTVRAVGMTLVRHELARGDPGRARDRPRRSTASRPSWPRKPGGSTTGTCGGRRPRASAAASAR